MTTSTSPGVSVASGAGVEGSGSGSITGAVSSTGWWSAGVSSRSERTGSGSGLMGTSVLPGVSGSGVTGSGSGLMGTSVLPGVSGTSWVGSGEGAMTTSTSPGAGVSGRVASCAGASGSTGVSTSGVEPSCGAVSAGASAGSSWAGSSAGASTSAGDSVTGSGAVAALPAPFLVMRATVRERVWSRLGWPLSRMVMDPLWAGVSAAVAAVQLIAPAAAARVREVMSALRFTFYSS